MADQEDMNAMLEEAGGVEAIEEPVLFLMAIDIERQKLASEHQKQMVPEPSAAKDL